MWVASWLVCVASIGCQEIAERNTVHFFTEKDCYLYAYQTAIEAQKLLEEQGHKNKISFMCVEDKKIKQSKQ